MARYTGEAAPFLEAVQCGWETGRLVLKTDEGILVLHDLRRNGSDMSGTTEDGRSVTFNITDPDNIIIA